MYSTLTRLPAIRLISHTTRFLIRKSLINMAPTPASDGKNPTIVLVGKEKLEIQDRPIPTYGDNEVLIKVMATGLCGTDVSFFKRGGIGSRVIQDPLVLGHEGAGIIEAVGANVTNVKVGDHVAIEPALPCHICQPCRAGQSNYCVKDVYFATPGHDGTLCRWYAINSANAVLLPKGISWKEAGCIQPLAISVQIARRAGKIAHQNVAVLGCGPLGLLIMAVCKAYGARTIVGIDIHQHRLDFAKEYAATHVDLSPKPADGLDWAIEYARKKTPEWGAPLGMDLVIDATGAQPCMQLACMLSRPGGTIMLAGMGPDMSIFPTLDVAARELSVIGSLRYTPRCFEDAIHLVDAGLVNLKPLVSKTFPLAEAADAIRAGASGKEIKIVILNQE